MNYTYDHTGLLVERTEGTDTTRYLWATPSEEEMPILLATYSTDGSILQSFEYGSQNELLMVHG